MALKDLIIKLGVRGDKKAKAKLKSTESSLSSIGKSAIKTGLAFFGARALIEGFKQVVELTGRQQEAEASLNAVLASTRQVAGLTSEELFKMASGFQAVTKFGDEAVIEAQSLMLTFTQVGKEVFPDAIETVLNMSSAMGTDLKSSVVQLGKALNDPIKGVAALNRVGVQLTDQQKKAIKSFQDMGDMAGAQKVILGELETQFGGLARAQSQTFAGSLAQMKNAIGDTAEVLGNIFQPALEGSAKVLKGFAVNLKGSLSAFAKIDLSETGKKFLKSSQALTKAFKAQYSAFFDILPDIFKAAFNKILPVAKLILTTFLDLIKEAATIAWEPLVVAITHVGERISQGFKIIINGMLGGLNLLIEKTNTIGEFLGFENIKPINLLEIVPVDPLLEKLKETKIGQFITPTDSDIDTIVQYTAATNEIWAEYLESIKVLKKEEREEDIIGTEDAEQIKKDAILKNLKDVREKQIKAQTAFKKNVDLTVKFADGLYKHNKMLLDQKMNDEIQATLKSKMSEEEKEAAIANIKEKFRQKDISAKKKMRIVKLSEAITNTALAITEALPDTFKAFMAGALGAVQIATIGAQEFASGGIVQGIGNRDTVPTMLTPGELILNKAQQDNLSGGMSGVTINIGGNIIGEESFVRDTLIPEIERARTLA